MQLTIADEFFNEHPLKEHYFSFSEAERAGTLAVAERDILALLAGSKVTEDEEPFFQAAIAEQSIFLLLNPEYLTGAYTRTVSISSSGHSRKFSGQESVLGQRAAALLTPILLRISEEKNKNGENNSGENGNTGNNGDDTGENGDTGNTGDTGENGDTGNNGDDTGGSSGEELCRIVRLSRG